MKNKIINKFHTLTKEKKIIWLVNNFLNGDIKYTNILKKYWNSDTPTQELHDTFVENPISNFYFPFSIAPNFLIDNKIYALPMAIEESSVVAAASKAAKFWLNRGGFKTKLISFIKTGHTHFIFDPKNKNFDILKSFFYSNLKFKLFEHTNEITKNMRKRGGGILSIELVDKTTLIPGYFQIKANFNTKDAMGANFINSCLEKFAEILIKEINDSSNFSFYQKKSLKVIMSILSNYTPLCLVHAEVECKIKDLSDKLIRNPQEFAQNFYTAIEIAKVERFRATTHNKGIMNGIDSLIIATGNDFRAVEACVHSFASRNGKYLPLTQCSIKKEIFKFYIDLPISVGVIGGLTSLHPLVKIALNILGNPNAQKLMSICAVLGLAQNFSALFSLITTGIQKGHMQTHLLNILNNFKTTKKEQQYIISFFQNKPIIYYKVVEKINEFRNKNYT